MCQHRWYLHAQPDGACPEEGVLGHQKLHRCQIGDGGWKRKTGEFNFTHFQEHVPTSHCKNENLNHKIFVFSRLSIHQFFAHELPVFFGSLLYPPEKIEWKQHPCANTHCPSRRIKNFHFTKSASKKEKTKNFPWFGCRSASCCLFCPNTSRWKWKTTSYRPSRDNSTRSTYRSMRTSGE